MSSEYQRIDDYLNSLSDQDVQLLIDVGVPGPSPVLSPSLSSQLLDIPEDLEASLEYDSDAHRLLDERLASVNYNLNLLSLESYASSSSSNACTSSSELRIKKPDICRHFLAGSCFRSDCWFSHDLNSTICKFYLNGFCHKGTDCPFVHESQAGISGYIQAVEKERQQQQQNAHVLDENYGYELDESESKIEFPSLEATLDQPLLSEPSSSSPSPSNPISKATSLSSKLAPQRIDFWGPTAPFSKIAATDPNKLLETQLGHLTMNQGIAKRAVSGTAMRYLAKNTALNDSEVSLKKVNLKGQIGWMSTGAQVDKIYRKHREDAARIAEQRNKFFQLATHAYKNGNPAAAKRFSEEAWKLDAEMQDLNVAAADGIYEERNKGKLIGDYGNDERVIDLHGLHAREAVYFVKTALDGLKREGFRGQVSVVTGTGHHSRGGVVKVLPAVREFLKSGAFGPVREGTLGDGFGGVFVVLLG